MMDYNNLDDLPEDDQLRQAIMRAKTQIENLQTSLEYNFMTVQLIVDPEGSINVALVAHNPCDLKQFQVVAFLPTLDNSLDTLKANEYAGKEVAKLEENMPEAVANAIMDLCIKRFAHAGSHNPEAFIRLSRAPDFETARAVYQEIHGLTEGGDFNHPLQ